MEVRQDAATASAAATAVAAETAATVACE